MPFQARFHTRHIYSEWGVVFFMHAAKGIACAPFSRARWSVNEKYMIFWANAF
jgi:hypothetical protein